MNHKIKKTRGHNLIMVNSRRSAIMPYTVIKGEIYFLMGIDAFSGDLSDFGGGVKKNENVFFAAIREFKEETRGIFGNLYENFTFIGNNPAYFNDLFSVIFIPLDNIWFSKNAEGENMARENFHSQGEKNIPRCWREMKDLVWISEKDFFHLLEGKSLLWGKLRTFYKKFANVELSNQLKDNFRPWLT